MIRKIKRSVQYLLSKIEKRFNIESLKIKKPLQQKKPVEFLVNKAIPWYQCSSLESVADLPKIFGVQGKISGVRGVQ